MQGVSVYGYPPRMTPRKPTGRDPGRPAYADPAKVRAVVRSTRFTAAEDELIAMIAGPGGVAAWLHDVAVRAAKRHKPSQRPAGPSAPKDTSAPS